MEDSILELLGPLVSRPSQVFILLLVFALLIKRSWARPILITFSLFISVRYFFWRGAYTLNTADYVGIAISLTLLLAELYGFSQHVFFIYQSKRPVKRKLPVVSDEDLPIIDVMITVFNEPIDILRRTVVGALAQDYPKERFKVYVLDDGNRGEVKALAKRLGCGYITRTTNEGAKAGNLNNAFKYTDGETIAVFDCDHVPVRSFLRETAPYFSDKLVAFIQTPHHFYNPDIYQRNLHVEENIVNEQDLFFKVVQSGRDYYNSAFFAGSGGLFRRSALEELGGIKDETVTEDLHTSMALHARGYKSVYVNKNLSAGLSPESSGDYIKQRKRWARGGLQIFMIDNPLFKRGLTFNQRLNYFASIVYFFHGLPRIIYLTAPLAYLLFGYPPLISELGTLLYYFVPHYAVQLMVGNLLSRGYRNPFWSDVYETLMCFGLTAVAFITVIRPRGTSFVVTPKGLHRGGKAKLDISTVFFQLTVLFLLLGGIVIGFGSFYYKVGNVAALAISFWWAVYNSIIAAAAVLAAMERVQRRGTIRLHRRIKCELELESGVIECVTEDISEGGLSVSLEEPVRIGESEVTVKLISDYGEVTRLNGEVVREDILKGGVVSLGIEFKPLTDEELQGVIRHIYSPEDSWSGIHKVEQKGFISMSFFTLLLVPVKNFIAEKVLRRFAPRRRLSYPAVIKFAHKDVEATIMDISYTGLSAEVASTTNTPLPKELILEVDVGGQECVKLRGRVVWQLNATRRTGPIFGLRFLDEEEGERLWRGIKAAA